MQARSFLFYLLLGFVSISPSLACASPLDDYGPACQWIRLFGEIQRPAGLPEDKAVLLTVTYRLPEQKTPATLLVNYPIHRSKFVFVLAGFPEKIQDVLFVPPDFFFADQVEFQYFAVSSDHQWRSEQKSSFYHPERIKKDGQVRCQTSIQLEPLRLEP